MTGRTTQPPSPSESGFRVDRRRFLVGVAATVGAGAVSSACGSEDAVSTSVTTLGSNYSDGARKAGIQAAVEATGVNVQINTVEHTSYQGRFDDYIEQPDDVVSWFAGHRMRALARRGAVGAISDVWAADLGGMSEGFKSASSLDGQQYFVPFSFYAWGVHYRKSLFAERSYGIPTTWDELLALCAQMTADGITPLAAANDGRWQQMSMFDMINLRTNGYDYHVSLMGGAEDWSSDRVKDVFAKWEMLLPYYEPDANEREWQAAAKSLGDKTAGMFLIGNFVIDGFEADTEREIIDDIDFFAFPEINPEHGQDAIEAPIDGFMMAARPANETLAKALLGGLGSSAAIDAYTDVDPSVVGASSGASSAGYGALQRKAAELVGSARLIAQGLDRETDPAFALEVLGVAFADFLNDPSAIDAILSDVEERKGDYDFG